MDQLQSELLLLIFKQLDSNEMVKVTRVCKTWFDVINENQSPWRSLVLQDGEHGWDASIIELFDRKSQSTLQTVSMRVCEVHAEQIQSVRATLERSKHSLQYLHLLDYSSVTRVGYVLEDLTWKLPNLVHCVIIGLVWAWSPTRIVQNSLSREPSSSLRTLWILFAPSLLQSHLHIIDKVASLHVEDPLSSSEWRRILARPAKTLKDLKFNIRDDGLPTPQSSLDFPSLRVLSMDSLNGFPSWMKIPSSSTYINQSFYTEFSDLPSVSKVWVQSAREILALGKRNSSIDEAMWLKGKEGKVMS